MKFNPQKSEGWEKEWDKNFLETICFAMGFLFEQRIIKYDIAHNFYQRQKDYVRTLLSVQKADLKREMRKEIMKELNEYVPVEQLEKNCH